MNIHDGSGALIEAAYKHSSEETKSRLPVRGLVDMHIDHVQALLCISHPAIDGLQSTVLSESSSCQLIGTPKGPFVQIMNFVGNHWICMLGVWLDTSMYLTLCSMYTG